MGRKAKDLSDDDIRNAAAEGIARELYEGTPGLILRIHGERSAVWRWGGIRLHGERVPVCTIGPAVKPAWKDKEIKRARLAAQDTAERWRKLCEESPGLKPSDIKAKEDGPKVLKAQERKEAAAGAPKLRDYITGPYREHIASVATRDALIDRIRACFFEWKVPADVRKARPVHFGDWRIDEIDQEVVDAWDDEHKHKMPRTRKKDLGALHAALNPSPPKSKPCRVLKSWVKASPFRVQVRVDDKHDRYLKTEADGEHGAAEFDRLVSALDRREQRMRDERRRYNEHRIARGRSPLPDLDAQTFADHLKPLILTLLLSGMRPKEVSLIEWSTVDFAKRTITLSPEITKTKKGRAIPLRTQLADVLQKWKEQTANYPRKLGTPHLVFRLPDGRPIGSYRTAWRNLLRDAGIENFRRYDLRHTFASWAVSNGMPLFKVGTWMGHQDPRTTAIYSHLAPASQDDLDALDAMVPNAKR